jgi:hypothetical protein
MAAHFSIGILAHFSISIYSIMWESPLPRISILTTTGANLSKI